MAQSPPFPAWLPWLMRVALSALCATWRVRYVGREAFDEAVAAGGAVLAFWHGQQLPIVFLHRDRGFMPIISQSRDGELLARLVSGLGYEPVRGSSSRGGSEAFAAGLRALAEGRCPGLAVDGPRGPRLEPKHGALTLAARSGRPVLHVTARAARAIRLRSWDRFEIPLPFTRIEVRYGRMEPPEPAPESIERARVALRDAMTGLSALETTPP